MSERETPQPSRRAVLMAGAGMLVGLALGSGRPHAAVPPRTRWILSGLYDFHEGTFAIGLLDLVAERRVDLPVTHRGHGLCLHPTKPDHAIIFAQRPGTVSYEFDSVRRRVTKEFRTGPGRHFHGHGVGIATRGAVFCSEDRYAGDSGVVTVRDAQTYEVMGEFSSHGLGPHDMRLLGDGRTIAIANGGRGEDVVGTRQAEASLALIDTVSGELEERIAFPGALLKHLDVSAGGSLGLALRGRDVSLCVVRRPDGTLVRAEDPGGLFEAMGYHTLSIRICDRTSTVGVTAPHGNLVAFWDSRTGEAKKVVPIDGAAGLELTHDQRHFVVTSRGGHKLEGLTSDTARGELADGRVIFLDAASLEPVSHGIAEPSRTVWESHSLAVVDE